MLADDVSRAELTERMRDATRGMHTELEETERKRQAGVGALAPRPIVLAACEDEVVTSRQVAGWYEGAQQVDADAALGDENKRHAARLAARCALLAADGSSGVEAMQRAAMG